MNGIHFGLLLFVRFQARKEIFLFSRVSRKVLGHTQHPIRWVMGTLSQRLKQLRRKVYTHLHLVHRLIITGGIPPVTYMPSWRTQEELYVISLRFVQSFEFLQTLVQLDKRHLHCSSAAKQTCTFNSDLAALFQVL